MLIGVVFFGSVFICHERAKGVPGDGRHVVATREVAAVEYADGQEKVLEMAPLMAPRRDVLRLVLETALPRPGRTRRCSRRCRYALQVITDSRQRFNRFASAEGEALTAAFGALLRLPVAQPHSAAFLDICRR